MRHFLSILTIVILLPGARTATGQQAVGTFCDGIRIINQQAASSFAGITGPQSSQRRFTTSLTLPRARECYITISKQTGHPRFNCDWDIVKGRMNDSYLTVAKGIANCLPGSVAKIDPPNQEDPVASIKTSTAEFYLSPESDTELDLWAERN
jgi:hypothetical protein